jgi:glucose uptake protein
MFTPQSFTIALLMMITTAFCWGSWANTFKGVKNYRFELFYWDYAIGIFLISLILALTMGSSGHDANSFLNNVHSADSSNIVSAMLGGVVFNLANLLLVAAIGIALVVGVVTSFLLQPRGNALMLGAGVACAFVAVVLDGKAYGQLAAASKRASRKSIVVCVVSGVLMGIWAPFVTRAMTAGHTLGPYSIAVFLTLGALLSCFVWNIYFMKKPLVGEPAIWGLGTVFNLVAASFSGVAISYAIGQSAPMVAALWGVLVWKEFAGANRAARAYLALMFVFYVLAIILIARAYTA